MTKEEWVSIRKQFPEGGRGQWTLLLWLVDLCILGVAWAVWVMASAGFQFAGLPLAALAILHSYLILHEAIHGTVSENRRMNDFVGHFCGWLIFLPFAIRRKNHVAHHTWTSHPTHDPENKSMIEKFAVMTEREEKKLEFMWRHWIPMIAANHFIGHWRAPFLARAKGDHSPRVKKEIRFVWIYLTGYAGIVGLALSFHVIGALICFYLPVWLFLLVMVELLNLPHHAEAPLQPKDADRLPLWEQDVVSHDCRTLSVWSRCVILNFNLHIVHHLFPWVPWYRLPRIRKLLMEQQNDAVLEPINEWRFALKNRRRPLLKLMGHFFDRRSAHEGAAK